MHALAGKIAIVTGASTGMGRAIALALAGAGASLALVARNAAHLEETAAASRTHGGEAVVYPGDVADQAFARQVIEETVGRFGRLDLLVNNAGTSSRHRNLADISVTDWRRTLETNLTGAFLFTRYILPVMRAAGGGQIINISSGAGLTPSAPAGVAYSASKHALHSLTGSINVEERRHGIRACVIAPGETDTPILHQRPLMPSAEGRATMLRAEDIGNAVLFVASQPAHVAVELVVVTPTRRRNYHADYERYVAEGHTQVPLD
ncbi:MAG: SDR family oxidoreductase [Candidatus Methylomirabilota bacterium]